MKIGIGVTNFSWPRPATEIGATVARIARTADAAGIDTIWTMDHFFQIRVTGLPPEAPMLEAYATLAFIAGNTRRIGLGTMVTSVSYRHPGVLIKTVTSLDVLSGGRIVFGVGAGAPFNIPSNLPLAEARVRGHEVAGLGIPFPSLAERFERLEELLQIAHQMWRGDEAPFEGTHYRLARPLNSPNSLQRPHPPILVGGSGERKTLRLVARYADACNLFEMGPQSIPARTVASAPPRMEVQTEACSKYAKERRRLGKLVAARKAIANRGLITARWPSSQLSNCRAERPD